MFSRGGYFPSRNFRPGLTTAALDSMATRLSLFSYNRSRFTRAIRSVPTVSARDKGTKQTNERFEPYGSCLFPLLVLFCSDYWWTSTVRWSMLFWKESALTFALAASSRYDALTQRLRTPWATPMLVGSHNRRSTLVKSHWQSGNYLV